MNKKELLIVSVLVVIVAVASSLVTWAFLYLSTTKPIPTTVTIGYTTSIGVYSDPDATDPVESIDFLVLLPSQIAYKTLYLKNEGSSSVGLAWYSNCSERTGNKIADYWTYYFPYPDLTYPIENRYLDPEDILETYYAIDISSDIPSDTYNWYISI